MKRGLLAFALILLIPISAYAGGLIGDIVNKVAPGAGTALDDAHRKVKEDIKPYGQAEEAISAPIRKAANEIGGEVGGPALAAWIRASKRNVENAGVRPIPPQVFQALRGYFPDEVLNSVRYRSGWGNEVSLPALSFRFGDATAITLDNVVMFREESDAQYNLALWAHEVSHVQQYRSWGIDDFAKRYVKDYEAIEDDAENNASRFLVWQSLEAKKKQQNFSQYHPQFQPQPSPSQASPFGAWPSAVGGMPPSSNVCRTRLGACYLPGRGPIGIGCWCASPYGPITGAIMN